MSDRSRVLTEEEIAREAGLCWGIPNMGSCRIFARRIEALVLERICATTKPPAPEFLRWVAERFVFVYHESQNMDYVQAIRRLADVLERVAADEKARSGEAGGRTADALDLAGRRAGVANPDSRQRSDPAQDLPKDDTCYDDDNAPGVHEWRPAFDHSTPRRNLRYCPRCGIEREVMPSEMHMHDRDDLPDAQRPATAAPSVSRGGNAQDGKRLYHNPTDPCVDPQTCPAQIAFYVEPPRERAHEACPCAREWAERVPALSRCQYRFCMCRAWPDEVAGLPPEAFATCTWPGHAAIDALAAAALKVKK